MDRASRFIQLLPAKFVLYCATKLLLLRFADRRFLPLLFLRFERYLLAFKLQNQRAIFRPEWQPLCFGDGDISGIRPSSMRAAIVVCFKPGRFNRIPFLRARHSSVNRRELLSTGTTLAAGREFLVMMVSLPVPASRMIEAWVSACDLVAILQSKARAWLNHAHAG